MCRKKKPVSERFWGKVRKSDSGCWEWLASKKHGYGQFSWRGTMALAHRVAWELTFGVGAGDSCVLHRCDNPGCVNPEHLFLGTHNDNVQDKLLKGRGHGPQLSRPGERSGTAVLMADEVKELRRFYASGLFSQVKLGKMYGIGQGHVSRIVRGEAWWDYGTQERVS